MGYSKVATERAEEMYNMDIGDIWSDADERWCEEHQSEGGLVVSFYRPIFTLILASMRYYQLFIERAHSRRGLSEAEECYLDKLYTQMTNILSMSVSGSTKPDIIDPLNFQFYAIKVEDGKLTEPWRKEYIERHAIPYLLQDGGGIFDTFQNIIIGCALAAVIKQPFSEMKKRVKAAFNLKRRGFEITDAEIYAAMSGKSVIYHNAQEKGVDDDELEYMEEYDGDGIYALREEVRFDIYRGREYFELNNDPSFKVSINYSCLR